MESTTTTHRTRLYYEGDSQQAVGATNALRNAFKWLTQDINVQKHILAEFAANMATNVINKLNQYRLQLQAFIYDSTMLAAKLETMEISMLQVGHNAGYSEEQLRGFENELRKSGITTEVARDTLIRMTRAEIDLSKAKELGRIAQDAAVVSNLDSSQALGQLIYGIQTQSAEILDNLGLQIRLGQAVERYAKENNKSAEALTTKERMQAVLNETVRQGAQIQGIYENSMQSAAKQAGSLTRHIANVKQEIGEKLQPLYSAYIMAQTHFWKSLYNFMLENEEQLNTIGYFLGQVVQIALDLGLRALPPLLNGLSAMFSWISGLVAPIAYLIDNVDKLGGTVAVAETIFNQFVIIAGSLIAYGLAGHILRWTQAMIGYAASVGLSIAAMGAFKLVAIGAFIGIAAIIGAIIQAFNMYKAAMENTVASMNNLANAHDQVDESIYRSTESMGNATDRAAAAHDQMSAMYDSTLSDFEEQSAKAGENAYGWGANLIIQFANGIAAGIGFVLDQLTALASMIAYWLKPGSPPRILPDIDIWGKEIAQVFMGGFSNADVRGGMDGFVGRMKNLLQGFDVTSLDTYKQISSTLEDMLRTSSKGGEGKDSSLLSIIAGKKEDIAEAIKQVNQLGAVTEDIVANLSSGFGESGSVISDYIKNMLQVHLANSKVLESQKALKEITDRYTESLIPLQRELAEIQNIQAKSSFEKEQKKLEEVIAHKSTTFEEKREALLALQSLRLREQIRLTEDAKSKEETAINDQLRLQTKELEDAKEKLAISESMLGIQKQNLSLVSELEKMLNNAGGSMDKAMGGARGMADALAEAAKNVDKFTYNKDSLFGDVGGNIEKFIEDLTKPFDDLETKFFDLGEAVNKIFDMWDVSPLKNKLDLIFGENGIIATYLGIVSHNIGTVFGEGGLFWLYFDGIKGKAKESFGGIGEAVTSAFESGGMNDAIDTFFNESILGLGNFQKSIKDSFGIDISPLTNALISLLDIFSDIWDVAKPFVDSLKEEMSPLFDELKEQAIALKDELVMFADDLEKLGFTGEWLAAIVGGILAVALSALVGIITGLLAGFRQFIIMLRNLAEPLKEWATAVMQQVDGLIEVIAGIVNLDPEMAKEGLNKFWEGVKAGFTAGMEVLWVVFDGIINTVYSFFGGFLEGFVTFLGGLWQKFSGEELPTWVETLKAIFNDLSVNGWQIIKDFLGGIITSVGTWITDSGIKFSTWVTNTVSSFTETKNSATTQVTLLYDNVIAWFESMRLGIEEKINDSRTKVELAFTTLHENLFGEEGIVTKVHNTIFAVFDSIKSTIVDKMAVASDAFTSIHGVIDGFWQKLKDFKAWLDANLLSIGMDFPDMPGEWESHSPIVYHQRLMDMQKYLKENKMKVTMDFPQTPNIMPQTAQNSTSGRVAQNQSSQGESKHITQNIKIEVNDKETGKLLLKLLQIQG